MLAQWQPVNSANSIDMVAIVIGYSTPIPDLVLQRLFVSQEEFARSLGLSDVSPIQGFQFAFGGLAGSPLPVQIGGKLMSVADSSPGPFNQGFSEQIQIDANTLIYRTTRYSSWSEVIDRYMGLVGDTLIKLSDIIAPASIRLEYLDRFVNAAVESTKSASGLLRAESKYLAPHVMDLEEMWHSHTGAFLPKQNGRSNLLQVNIDAIDMSFEQHAFRSLQIMSAREDRFPPDSIELDRGAPNMVAAALHEMHSELMQVYRELVADEVVQSVGLES